MGALLQILPVKSRKRGSRDVLDTFATHFSIFDDVTDTDCCAQKGGSRYRDIRTSTYKQEKKYYDSAVSVVLV